MPVFSMGGMRYQHKWSDVDPSEISAEGQANIEEIIQKSVSVGMNHIETARGYGSSEMQLGWVLPKFPREKLIVQTKIGPSENPDNFLNNFEKSMGYLKVGYVDLLAFHGINNDELLDFVLRKGGCMDAARQLQRDGRVRFIGFSTHGPTPTLVKACDSGEFDYMNVHWYFVNDLNWPAIEAASNHDMGVFIISPNDKGGKLYDPPDKLVELCKPLTPMQFNDLYCLARPEVHTLSLGASRPSDLDEHLQALEFYDRIAETIAPIEARIREEIAKTVGRDWMERWSEGVPEFMDIPGEVNVREILRLWTFAKSLDLVEWGKMRYNLLGNAGHWLSGQNATKLDETFAPALAKSPFADRIPSALREAHEMLAGEQQKRQSES
jgi:hypothetical protein